MINVTKTFLPPQKEYNAILKRAWDKNWITNRGVLVQDLENKLINYLGVKHLIATTNGTLPLQIAIKSLKLEGEVITTPFSYVATTASIAWEGCTPVFVDIHPDFLTIDESKIEAAITKKTSAILATHVFGNPCDIESIEALAKKHQLKVIYDGAHCFGVRYKERSIFNYGDVSTCSFHATKLFHTGEGGGLFCKDEVIYHELFYAHNFGHNGPLDFQGLGINGKISELQAGMGLAVLPYMDEIVRERGVIINFYNENLDFNKLKKIEIRKYTEWNNSYYPIIFENENQLLHIEKILNDNKIFPRRYFYPSLNTLRFLKFNSIMPISESISARILCLPLYHGLDISYVNIICKLINRNLDFFKQ